MDFSPLRLSMDFHFTSSSFFTVVYLLGILFSCAPQPIIYFSYINKRFPFGKNIYIYIYI